MKLSLVACIGTCATLVALQIAPAEAALTISGNATSHVTCASGVCTASAKNATLNVSDLTNLLATQNVTIRSGKKAVDIDVASPFGWASKFSLKLDATGSLNVEGTVSDTGKASLTIVTGDGGSGALSFGSSGNITFMGTANSLTINGAPFALVGNIAALAAAVSENPAGNYALAKNYNASHDGTYTSAPVPTLNGAFEGLGNTISGLAIADTAGSDLVGLFVSIVGSPGAVRDLHLVNVAVSGGDTAAVGAVAGYLQGGAASNIWVTGHVQAGNGVAAGGMFGDVFGGTVTGMFSSAAVTIGDAQGNGGRVAGYNDGTMLLSSASGAVTGGTEALVGGLVGSNQGSIASSYATGKVAANGGGSNLGGLVGLTSGPISTS